LLRSYSIPDRRSRNGSQTQNRTIQSHLVFSYPYFCFTKHLSLLCISDTYLQTNDQINGVLSRYEAFKRGETPPASIPAEFLPGKNEPLSLIDLDDAQSQPGSGSRAGSNNKPEDDLAGLFESAASLTSVPATSPPAAAPSGGLGTFPLLSNVANQQTSAISPQLSSPLPGTSTPSHRPQSQFGQIKLPSTPPLQSQSQGSGRVGPPSVSSPLAPARASPSSNLAATSIPQQPLVPQATSVPPISQVSTPQGKDPFADLAGLF
jgi:ADP-ribosylation factor-binding protein GGA